MEISIRDFIKEDIPLKLRWINNPENNRYLHYDLPLEQEKTEQWFQKVSGQKNRRDCVMEVDGVPCGVVGLLNIDMHNGKAELYMTMGEPDLRGKGITYQAIRQLLHYAFDVQKLNRIYAYTETENTPARSLFQKIGFELEGVLRADLFFRGNWVDRCVYAILKEDFEKREGSD